MAIYQCLKDTWLDSDNSGNNYGGNPTMDVKFVSDGKTAHYGNGLFEFNIGRGVHCSRAFFCAQALTVVSPGPFPVYRQYHTDWVELEANWSRYKVGSNWGTGGGDYSYPPPAAITTVTATGLNSWDITAHVNYARDYIGGVLELGMAPNDPSNPSIVLATREHATASYHPFVVVIEYALVAAGYQPGSYPLAGPAL